MTAVAGPVPQQVSKPSTTVVAAKPQRESVIPELLREVKQANDALAEVLQHDATLDKEVINDMRSARQLIDSRSKRRELAVAVVGEKKAGKSTFLNAILGRRVLGAANREFTGTVTHIRRGAIANYRAVLKSGSTECFAEVVPNPIPELQKQLQQSQRELGTLRSRGIPVPRQLGTQPAIELDETGQSAAFESYRAKRQEEMDAATPDWESGKRQIADFESQIRQVEAKLPFFYRRWPMWMRIMWIPCYLFTFLGWLDERRLLDVLCRRQSKLKQETQGHRAKVLAPTIQLLTARIPFEEQYRDFEFCRRVASLTDMQQRGPELDELFLEYPARYLPEDLIVIDTPGVNTDNVANRGKAWEAIQREADGCLLLSDLSQPLSVSTQRFLAETKSIVPHVILMLTRIDEALADAQGIGQDDAETQLAEARRVGVKTFAKQVGRAPSDVLAFAVAALRALPGPDFDAGFASRFESDLQQLLEVLKHERALILGTRSATVLRKCIGSIASVKERAELDYRTRIETLEAQRIPEPDRFCWEQMQSLAPEVESSAKDIVDSAWNVAKSWLEEAKSASRSQIESSSKYSDLKSALSSISSSFEMPETIASALKVETPPAAPQEGMSPSAEYLAFHQPEQYEGTGWRSVRLHHRLKRRMAEKTGQALNQLRSKGSAALRDRYRIVSSAATVASAAPPPELTQVRNDAGSLGTLSIKTGEGIEIAQGISSVGIGTALAVILGSIFPIIGHAFGFGLGAALGALVMGVFGDWIMTGDKLREAKSEAKTKLFEAFKQVEDKLREEVIGRCSSIESALRTQCETDLAGETKQFSNWISQVLTDEGKRILDQRSKLQHLLALADRLRQHDRRLADLLAAATDESQALCKNAE